MPKEESAFPKPDTADGGVGLEDMSQGVQAEPPVQVETPIKAEPPVDADTHVDVDDEVECVKNKKRKGR